MLFTVATAFLALYFLARGAGPGAGEEPLSRLRRLDGRSSQVSTRRASRRTGLAAALLEMPRRIAPPPLRRLMESGLADIEPLSGLTLERMVGMRAWASAGLPVVVIVSLGFSRLSAALAFPLSAVGFMLPVMLASRRRKAYLGSVLADLPYAADLLFAHVLGGKNLDQAFRGAAKMCPGALGELLTRAVREMDLGAGRDEAFAELTGRCPVGELSSLLRSLLESERRGHELSETLGVFSREMRLRRRDEVRTKVAKAPLQMLAPLVFLILPASVLLTVGPTFLVTLRNIV